MEVYGVSHGEIVPGKKNVCIVMERLHCDMKSKIEDIKFQRGSEVS